FNQLRFFNIDANAFRPHLAQIVLEKEGKAGRNLLDRAGFRAKLDFGLDAKLIGGEVLGSPDDDLDFQEVYAQYIVPIGNGLDIRFGRMNTLIGYELIESPFNANFSRTWTYSLGQPFTTVGLRFGYQFNEYVFASVGVINGFEVLRDNNRGKTLEWLVALTPHERLGLTFYGTFGPEQSNTADSNGNGIQGDGSPGEDPSADRVLAGGILTVKATERTTFVLEAYYANDPNAITTTTARNARWTGIAGYVIYDFNERWGLHLRGEIFEDAGGTRTCVGPGGNNTCFVGFLGTPQTLWEATSTLQYRPVPSVITRLEFRYDKSDHNPFLHGTRAANNQETLAFQAIYLF
ncbi:MAG: outer membrane beta-barrel protein, partial [Nitrospirales bacterium]